MIYIIGSLRNQYIPLIAKRLREGTGEEIFDDWFAAGPTADDCWRDYEKGKGNGIIEALNGLAAKNVFEFDKRHLDAAESVVLVMPAGKSGFLELGYCLGKGKRGYILLDADPERYDVMFQFANGVYSDIERLIDELNAPANQLRKVSYPDCRLYVDSDYPTYGCDCPYCLGTDRDR